MANEVISYLEMCQRERVSLQLLQWLNPTPEFATAQWRQLKIFGADYQLQSE